MHLLPQGTSVGTTALLLPAVDRFFSKSLPRLLPGGLCRFVAEQCLGISCEFHLLSLPSRGDR
ncbi:hypothetical protein DXM21_21620 [Agrobacterium rosae]|nr:hypothetical protein DXM21_21620 [Agrobacterium rosae]KAA3516561.1 hypothetical protein DXM25_19825 [Agrobacterium rosae]MQB50367.1 hypothetical protein [Agrobacterium rosae]